MGLVTAGREVTWDLGLGTLDFKWFALYLCSLGLIFAGASGRPRCLRRRCAAARLLRSWVRIPLGAWMFVCCECCVLSGRGLCDELITPPEESYRLWCVVVCNLETSRMRRPWPALGRSATQKIKTSGSNIEFSSWVSMSGSCVSARKIFPSVACSCRFIIIVVVVIIRSSSS
jgi:hypothetical protein